MLTLECTPCTIACKLDLTAGQATKPLLGTCHPGTCHSRSRTPKYLSFWHSPAYPTAIVRLRLIAFKPSTSMVWVGGKKQISLSRFSPVALTALSTSFVTSALTQCVDSLNDSTDSLYRIFFVRSNGKLLEFLSTNYSNHISYHFCNNSGSQTFLCVCNTNGCVCTPTVVSLLCVTSRQISREFLCVCNTAGPYPRARTRER